MSRSIIATFYRGPVNVIHLPDIFGASGVLAVGRKLGEACKTWCELYVAAQHDCDLPDGDDQRWHIVEGAYETSAPGGRSYCCPECGEAWARSDG